MAKRLTAQDWIDFALKSLARDGFEALKADVLARKLDVSRGSFYWHFTELADFHAQVIAHWRQTATDAIITDLEGIPRATRLDALLQRAFSHSGALELRMRAWADHNAQAEEALRDIDRRRCAYIERMLADEGVALADAATRAQVLYWAYLGAALSRTKLQRAALKRMVDELKRIGLGGPAAGGARPRPRGRRTARTKAGD
ncbi:MAG: TetR/AcrR family transcriptional regulator [Rhizobiales bacterium]|nr:TetR/AcrR family transcriptional regulator [Hyphomicrobiales bacterium]